MSFLLVPNLWSVHVTQTSHRPVITDMKEEYSLCLCLCFLLILPSVWSLGRHSGLGASELCEVNSRTKVGEGYHIAGKDQCAQFCKMTAGCEWWTWYYQVNQDDVTKARTFTLLDYLSRYITY